MAEQIVISLFYQLRNFFYRHRRMNELFSTKKSQTVCVGITSREEYAKIKAVMCNVL